MYKFYVSQDTASQIIETIINRAELLRAQTGLRDLPDGITVEGEIPCDKKIIILSLKIIDNQLVAETTFKGTALIVHVCFNPVVFSEYFKSKDEYIENIHAAFDGLFMNILRSKK